MFLGIDVGSISTEAVLVDDVYKILGYSIVKSGFDHKAAVNRVVEEVCGTAGIAREDIKRIVGTGYGRRNVPGTCKAITEISCHAMGIHQLFPSVRTVIDIGGQDSKVIRISEDGYVEDFVMNDKCAAGTGRFLEVMANAMDLQIENLGEFSLKAEKVIKISSTCTVFAESEVISKIAEGYSRKDIIAGIHNAIVDRVLGLANSVGIKENIAFTGGVAKNSGIAHAFRKRLGTVHISYEPQITGALGAAIFAGRCGEDD